MTKEITITDGAAVKIRALRAETKEDHGLRVKVVEGECSGFEYTMDLDSLSLDELRIPMKRRGSLPAAGIRPCELNSNCSTRKKKAAYS